MKSELIQRYEYIFMNSVNILAPFMYMESVSETKERCKRWKEKYTLKTKPLIYLNELDAALLNNLEELLLGHSNLENNSFYKMLEELKKDKNYQAKVKKGLELLTRLNNETKHPIFHKNLDIWTLLTRVREYILDQSGDLYNKKLKLQALDEYFRIARYSNDGKVWISGYDLLCHDIDNMASFTMISSQRTFAPTRGINDNGVKNNDFINYFSIENNSLSEEEKKEVYLRLHDVLAWDLKCTCIHNVLSPYIPENTTPCKKDFIIKEEEIFISPLNDGKHDFYQLCPTCGYMVNIPIDLLSEGIQKRIIDRCSKDHNLFRKKQLQSELKALNNGQKRILIKKNK